MRILYSFPFPLGSPGIGTTAAQQVRGLLNRGHDVSIVTTSVYRESPPINASITKTMAVGNLRIPHRVLGVARTMALHDLRVARRLRKHSSSYDVVHCWPGAALATCSTASSCGLPALREVPNTHTRNAYEVVGALCEELNVILPKGHSHRLDPKKLRREEAEYEAALRLLVPSEPVEQTFLSRGYPPEKLLRHQYGFDPTTFTPASERPNGPFHAVFLGTVEPRKGLHVALKAWQASRAFEHARFSIYGNIVDGYREIIEPYLSMPGVSLNGFVADTAAVLRSSDVLILPSFEEGSALVTYEAQGCGVIPMVSVAAGAHCIDGVTGVVHATGDVEALSRQISTLIHDRKRLADLRTGVLANRHNVTWDAAAKRLEECYQMAIDAVRDQRRT